MKKTSVIALAVLLALSMAACAGGRTAPEVGETTVAPAEETTVSAEDTMPESETVQTEQWGVTDLWVAERGTLESFYINFPAYTGVSQGSGLIADQADGTLVIVDRQVRDTSPEVACLEELFPAWFVQTSAILKQYYGLRADGFAFTVESKELTTINGYEMCRFSGFHTLTYKREPLTYRYVAYAAQLKSNGAYVYWMVMDQSQDQSLLETVESHAYRMALSLYEN